MFIIAFQSPTECVGLAVNFHYASFGCEPYHLFAMYCNAQILYNRFLTKVIFRVSEKKRLWCLPISKCSILPHDPASLPEQRKLRISQEDREDATYRIVEPIKIIARSCCVSVAIVDISQNVKTLSKIIPSFDRSYHIMLKYNCKSPFWSILEWAITFGRACLGCSLHHPLPGFWWSYIYLVGILLCCLRSIRVWTSWFNHLYERNCVRREARRRGS